MPQLKPEAPEVRCKQEPGPIVSKAPRADEWVEWRPPRPGSTFGDARLSKQAVEWITELLAALRVVEGLRGVEHKCLDDHEAKGLIRQ